MLRSMHSRELVEWRAFHTLHPLGEDKDDYRIAVLCMVIANSIAGRKDRRFTVEQFMEFLPWYRQEKALNADHERTLDEAEEPWLPMLSMVELLNEAMGGVDARPPLSEVGA